MDLLLIDGPVQDAIKQWGHKIPADEVMAIMAAADVDGDGFIDYNEFVAATMNVNQLEKEDLIYKAFQEFDEDGSNSISMDELERVWILSSLASTASILACGWSGGSLRSQAAAHLDNTLLNCSLGWSPEAP